VKVTRILYSKDINRGKFKALTAQAQELGKIRSEIWQRYGAINGVKRKDREIRNEWMAEGRTFNVSANAWKETLRDAIGDIKAYREAAKEKVKQAIRLKTQDDAELKRLYTLLKKDQWVSDPFLHRQMRKHYRHGKNKTHNQIVVRADNFTTFEHGGLCWLKIPSMEKGKRISIPLTTTIDYAPTGTLRIILKNGRAEIHHQAEIECVRDCGDVAVGIDKGFTEVFVDSDGEHYGKGLGAEISKQSDYLNKKYKNRNKIIAIAKKKPHKKAAIEANNLGRKKLDKQQEIHQKKIRTIVHTATNELVDKAGFIACEDLTKQFSSNNNYSKKARRSLNTWTKGVIAAALENISKRRGSSLHLVNAAYTSQMDSWNQGLFTGTRKSDKFYRDNGEVKQADHNGARNVLARVDDPDIGLYTPYVEVKKIVQARTDSYRLELTNQGSSCTPETRYQQSAN
jgi:IS605 OrfB family transposase